MVPDDGDPAPSPTRGDRPDAAKRRARVWFVDGRGNGRRAAVLADIARGGGAGAALRAAQSATAMARRARSEARAQQYPRLDAGSAFPRGDGPVYVSPRSSTSGISVPAISPSGPLNRPGYVSNIKKSFLRAGIFTGFEMQTARRLAGLAVTQAEVQGPGCK
ncbi:MAG: hypothetical protein IPJ35_05495 [Elusimicrobia bacterium]|nr:hypothetical protein [Elusimicrobiota bacterium]